MKKTKRLLALLLTFAALVSLLAFPAALEPAPIALRIHCIL